MAKFSTPSHPCEQLHTNAGGDRWRCRRDAYRRFGDQWLCRPHLRAARERFERLRRDGVFRCTKCGHETARYAQDPEWWVCGVCDGRMEAVR